VMVVGAAAVDVRDDAGMDARTHWGTGDKP
jgi:hypothetical protein